jgi:hypothetical protein
MSSVSALLSGTPAALNRAYLPIPIYGQFASDQSQTVSAINTATELTYNQTFIANGVDFDPANPSRVRIFTTGVYRFCWSVQLDKDIAVPDTAVPCDVWIAIDGVSVPLSACQIAINSIQEQVPFCEYILQLNAGQYVEVYFSSPSDTMRAAFFAAAAPRPAIPSIITTIQQIA